MINFLQPIFYGKEDSLLKILIQSILKCNADGNDDYTDPQLGYNHRLELCTSDMAIQKHTDKLHNFQHFLCPTSMSPRNANYLSWLSSEWLIKKIKTLDLN